MSRIWSSERPDNIYISCSLQEDMMNMYCTNSQPLYRPRLHNHHHPSVLSWKTCNDRMFSTSDSGAISRHTLILAAALASPSHDNNDEFGEYTNTTTSTSGSSEILNGKAAKGSGTTARGRRLLKIREDKRKREYDRLHNYPA